MSRITRGFSRMAPGTMSGQSRIATRPSRITDPTPVLAASTPPTVDLTCVISINASATGNTYASPRALVALDEAGMDNPCELNAYIQTPASVLGFLRIPPGDYVGITGEVVWDGGVTATVTLTVENEVTFLDEQSQSAVSSGVAVAIDPFTITGAYGRVYLLVDYFPDVGSHTVSPATQLVITKESA